jgi:hypothetical protein
MPLLNPSQRSKVGKGIAAANDVMTILGPLEKFAEAVPAYAERVADLRTKRDALLHICETLVRVDDDSREF